MANTLTGLIPTLYEALDVVSREFVGFIPAVTRDTTAERAALNQSILVPLTQAQALADNTSAVTAPNTGDQTVTSVTMTISKSKHVPVRWNGEDTRGMLNAGTYHGVLREQFTQGFRALANQIETDLWTAAYQASSRAFGTAGTPPFGTVNVFTDFANTVGALDVNGAPIGDRHAVFSAATVGNLRGLQTILLRTNESGSSAFRVTGSIADIPLLGCDLHYSAAPVALTKGTGTAYVTSGTAAVLGSTSILLKTGANNVVAGDVVTFTGDTNKYVVNTGITAPGTIVIGAPGTLTSAEASDSVAMTIGNGYTPNMVFHRSAMQLITRVPAMPIGFDGAPMDMADDVVQVTDPFSGITFEIALYRQFLQQVFHVRLAWGTAAIKPNHIATLMG